DHARIADHAASRLDDRFRDMVAEVAAQRMKDRLRIDFDRRNVLQVACWETAAEVNHLQIDSPLRQISEDQRCLFQSAIPHARIALLRADVKRKTKGDKIQAVGKLENACGKFRSTAELARQRPLRSLTVTKDAAKDFGSRRRPRNLFNLGLAIG